MAGSAAYVLDASAIAVILRKAREKAPKLLKGQTTLSLAYYELGNVLWKEAVLLKAITTEKALATAEQLAHILGEMRTEHPNTPKDIQESMHLALKTRLTFYDAAYLQTAKKLGATLVTEDEKLRKKAQEQGIKTLSTDQYIEKAARD